ncbi:GNAT family N-acetyltransferase [Ferdinandcohnia quinoae]|uniref:GNAT family N-acetyltransferase n=1 Tax=Fredinandcohnia quinoae TaxID=2918902 RepID=A0AAW5E7B5_9BACI|nr:GNAT family N-acetyltransferase [Fredinandcohnia sp. SECRCQ15]MCH1625807.1 GNAT family N-acetyltransferase [Fredinandcohnia sp. SECRCQ15]
MRIRQLTPLDARKYWDLRLIALKTEPEAFLTTYEEALEKENPIEEYKESFQSEDIFTFGAFEEEELFGVVTLMRDKPIKLRHRANIVAMYVDPEKRGAGVGKSLLMEAIRFAKRLGDIEQIHLTVNAYNRLAKKLYTDVGFDIYAFEKKAIKFNGIYSDEEHLILFLKEEIQ